MMVQVGSACGCGLGLGSGAARCLDSRTVVPESTVRTLFTGGNGFGMAGSTGTTGGEGSEAGVLCKCSFSSACADSPLWPVGVRAGGEGTGVVATGTCGAVPGIGAVLTTGGWTDGPEPGVGAGTPDGCCGGMIATGGVAGGVGAVLSGGCGDVFSGSPRGQSQ